TFIISSYWLHGFCLQLTRETPIIQARRRLESRGHVRLLAISCWGTNAGDTGAFPDERPLVRLLAEVLVGQPSIARRPAALMLKRTILIAGPREPGRYLAVHRWR